MNSDEPSSSCKVYTVNNESRFLKFSNVPSFKSIEDDLVDHVSQYGGIERCYEIEEAADFDKNFTKSYCIAFYKISESVYTKKKLNKSLFMGHLLKVGYAPEEESVEDVRRKYVERWEMVRQKLREQNKCSPDCPSANNKKPDLQMLPPLGYATPEGGLFPSSISQLYPHFPLPALQYHAETGNPQETSYPSLNVDHAGDKRKKRRL